MKRILWLSNIRFSNEGLKGTGTWLQPLAASLTPYYEIYHVCCGNVKLIKCETVGDIKQFIIPYRKTLNNTQIPDRLSCSDVRTILEEVKPDLIHVWGTESKWAYMKVLGVFGAHKTLLDMQGFLQSCYESYYAGLTLSERLQCYGLKEILRPSSSMYANKRLLLKKSRVENEILQAYDNISYQSEWICNRLLGIGLNAKLYNTKIIIRSEFFNNQWRRPDNSSLVIFTSAAVAHSYKGLHILIKACSVLKQKYPDFILYVAGRIMVKSYGILNGYESYLAYLIKKYRMNSNVKFLGPLSAEDMVAYQLKSNVCIVPSAVESYCLGLAECLTLGLPSVVSYSAAMPTIARDKEEVLFYSPLDYVDCAAKVMQIYESRSLSNTLSVNSRNRRILENKKEMVVEAQLEIYKSILDC